MCNVLLPPGGYPIAVKYIISYHIKILSYIIFQEYERESRLGQSGPWGMLLTHLPQIAVAERSYGELGFLLTKNKGFLRKDVGQMCVCMCMCAECPRMYTFL